ncbi:MAG: ABC transporter ATP-binding protein [Chloroflexi bacterium]|nr:ABC transporter ATP-binding protein [Chloroflexota bacterium]
MAQNALDAAGERRPLLTVSHLSATYHTEDETIPAVRDVSLELYEGEVLALVGESAAGKSSVAHAVLGLLPSTATVEGGDVQFRGRSLQALSTDELRAVRGAEIAMIFQDALAALTPTLRVGEQLAELFRAHRNMSEREANAEAMRVLGTLFPDPDRIFDSFPFQLSGGMAQRVMVALATALEPLIVIADEPTANLDPGVRMEMLQRLEAMRDELGVSILLITHDFGVVARLADRVSVMYAGEIVETADVRRIFRTPKHPYTFGLLQSLPTLESTERLTMMPGNPPDLGSLPPECPFLPRCRKATTQCRTDPAPRLVPVEGSAEGHLVACYNPMAVSLRD